MGRYRWYQVALLTFAFAAGVGATERVRMDPYIKAGPGYTATTGSVTGYVPTKSNQDLLLEAERKGWLGKEGVKTPVTVKPKVKVPVSGVAGKLKDLVRLNPARVMLGAATSTAVGAVGWVMTDGVMTKKKEVAVPPQGVADYAWTAPQHPTLTGQRFPSPSATCDAIAERGFTSNGVPVPGSVVSLTRSGDAMWKCTVLTPFGYNSTRDVWRNGSACPTGSQWNTTQGVCTKMEDSAVTESDLTALDPVISGATAQFIRDILQQSCEGSSNPQGCYDSLQKQAPPSISGPSTVPGPVSTTTGTYTRPDGTTGTSSSTSQTNFNIRYGDNYFDYDTTVTTTTTKDGQQVSEETTSDEGTPQESPPEEEEPEEQYSFQDSDLPEVEPFYEQKYPDGLQGVWDNARAQLDDSAFLSFLRSFVPSFSGTCPGFVMPLNIESWANYGNREIPGVCYALDFVKGFVLFGAVMLARRLTFGG